ncbi:hypothetical protein [Pseudomonas sp.]|uniref:hypothetical protein n=1 Tax=Pseudomonas sp. TaxID=306 RepID=UPI003CC6BA06
MDFMHVTAGGYPIAKTFFFTRHQAIKANGRRRQNKHNQIGCGDKRVCQPIKRTGQYPTVVTEFLLHR